MIINKKIKACVTAIAVASTLFSFVYCKNVMALEKTQQTKSFIKDEFPKGEPYSNWGCSLDGKYAEFNGTFSIAKSSKLRTLKISFYNGNVFMKTYTLLAGAVPTNIKLNLTGIKSLNIRTKNTPLTSDMSSGGEHMIKGTLYTDIPKLKVVIGKYIIK